MIDQSSIESSIQQSHVIKPDNILCVITGSQLSCWVEKATHLYDSVTLNYFYHDQSDFISLNCLYIVLKPAFSLLKRKQTNHIFLILINSCLLKPCVTKKFLLMLLKFVAFKCLCCTNDSITSPFKCASWDNVLPPEREEGIKLTSANSLCPQRLYYDFLLKLFLYNECSFLYKEIIPACAQKNFCLCSVQ